MIITTIKEGKQNRKGQREGSSYIALWKSKNLEVVRELSYSNTEKTCGEVRRKGLAEGSSHYIHLDQSLAQSHPLWRPMSGKMRLQACMESGQVRE